MTKRRKITIGIIAAILLVAAIVLFLIYRGFGAGIGAGDNVAYVQKVSDLTGHSVTVDRFGGVVEAQSAQSYKKDSNRTIEEVYVKVGDPVVAGTALFKYDVRPSENNLASAQLEIESLNNQIAYLQSEANTTENQLNIAERQLEIKQRQAEMEKFQQEIDNAEIKSEISGIVKSVNENIDENSADQTVVTISETGEFRVKSKVSEQSIGMLTSGMPVIVRSRVDESKTWTGTVTKIDTEPSNSNSGGDDMMYDYGSSGGDRSSSYPFYVSLDSTEGLMLGQHIFVEPDYGQSDYQAKEGIWLDESFVAFDDDGSAYVWVARNDKISKRPVEVGEIDENDFSIQIISGLAEDDLIAWPDETLREGMKAESITEDL